MSFERGSTWSVGRFPNLLRIPTLERHLTGTKGRPTMIVLLISIALTASLFFALGRAFAHGARYGKGYRDGFRDGEGRTLARSRPGTASPAGHPLYRLAPPHPPERPGTSVDAATRRASATLYEASDRSVGDHRRNIYNVSPPRHEEREPRGNTAR